MPNIITLENYNTIQFYQIPQAFYHNPRYVGMNPSSREAYAMLRNLLSLSINNGWFNEEGEIYVKLSREKLMLRLGIKKDKMAKVFKELRELELIVEKRVGCNKCNEIYICNAEDLNQVYSDKELLDLLSDEIIDETEAMEVVNLRNSEKQSSNDLINRGMEGDKVEFSSSEKPRYIKNNIIKTNSSKNNINKQQQQKEAVVASQHQNISLEVIDNEVIEVYKRAFGHAPKELVEICLRRYLSRFERDVVILAIEIAGNKGKGYDYAQGILKIWESKGLVTFDQVFEYEEGYKQ